MKTERILRFFSNFKPTRSEAGSEPEKPEKKIDDTLEDLAHQEIINLCEGHEDPELEKNTFDLYKVARDEFAPVFVNFADMLLKKASNLENGGKIIFMARDGLASYEAAKLLLEKFPDRYPGVNKDQILYVYLTRTMVFTQEDAIIKEYLEQEGIHKDDQIILADVGMYGSMISRLEELFKDYAKIESHQYLISRTDRAEGFLSDYENRQMSVFQQIPGNPAVHFLEDTFSGQIKSPQSLIKEGDMILPDTHSDRYDFPISLKRNFAIRGVRDFIKSIDSLDSMETTDQIRERLNGFLLDKNNFNRLMVPHER